MKISYLLLAALAFLAFTTVSSDDAPNLIVEIFRHGARGPETIVYDKDKHWASPGQLTASGMRMHYLLGYALKKQYPTLLDTYDPTKMYIRSTDVNRTIMSVYAHMYGIFEKSGPGLHDGVVKEEAIPPFQSEIIQKTVAGLVNTEALPANVHPMPVHVTSENTDNVLRPWSACPASNAWYANGMKDTESTAIFENDMKDLVKNLAAKDIKVKNMDELYSVADNAITNKFEGQPIPGGFALDSPDFRDLNFIAEWATIKSVDLSDTQRSLYAHGMLTMMYDIFQGKVKGDNNLEFVALSGHDTTLLSLLVPFGITHKACFLENYRKAKDGKELPYPECKFPIYASNLVFEFYKAEEPYILFKYNNKAVPFCGNKDNKCTLKEFGAYIKKVTKGYTASDFTDLCSISSPNTPTNYFWLVLCLILCVAFLGGYIFLRRQLQVKQTKAMLQPTQGGNEYLLGKN